MLEKNSDSKSQWLVPFKGRNHSGASAQNFLWRQENVYVMDNHRAAAWCWLQHIATGSSIGLLHIDEHFDTLYSQIDEWLANMPNLEGLSIDEYLGLPYSIHLETYPLIRWDNYLSLFHERYPTLIKHAVFATHGVGDQPKIANANHALASDLPDSIDGWLTGSPYKWIVNVDLDYFFCDQSGDRKLMFSDEYIKSVFCSIRSGLVEKRIACLTLCLTPDEHYTGGWQQAESLCRTVCSYLDVQFELPQTPIKG